MNLRDSIAAAVQGRRFTEHQARELFLEALGGAADPIQIGALLTAIAQRGEPPEEIIGAARALREACVPFEHDHPEAIDTCGTGGDGLGTFNVSTAAALVASAAGATVIKHGNRSVSSSCGSADLLEELGV